MQSCKGKDCPGYILLTAARNEEENLPGLIEGVIGQEARPSLWAIVDDSSEDNSWEIIEGYSRKHPWIRPFRYPGKREPKKLKHISMVKSYAARTLIDLALAEGVHYCYTGVLDADIRLESDFYSRMLSRLGEDPRIGLLGASILSSTPEGPRIEAARDDLPGSATMLCRRRCFEEIGGVPEEMYPEDAIMVAKAKLAGWNTERSERISALQTRGTGTREGDLSGYRLRGERVYFLRYHPLYILTRALLISVKKGPRLSYAFLSGYMRDYLSGAQRLEDRELARYFSRQRFREAIGYNLKEALKKIGKKKPWTVKIF